MSWLGLQVLWFVLAAGILFVEKSLMQKPDDPDNPDLKDRSVTPFLLLMFLFGGFVIPFYMWYSRRSVAAVMVGIALMAGCAVVVGIVAGAF